MTTSLRRTPASLPARAAAIRGDNLQHAVGLHTVLQALQDEHAESVSIEDPDGGAFDDVVLRRAEGLPGTWMQVKSSNYGGEVIDDQWLTTPRAKQGVSPLQAFHTTWRKLTDGGEPFNLELVTNRNFDHGSALFKALDKKSDHLDPTKLHDALDRPQTTLGRLLTTFATHLGTERTEVLEFLSSVTFRNEGSENAWRERISDLMRLNGFRGDDEAVTSALRMVSDWVTDGVGEVTVAEARRRLEDRDLLAQDGTLVLAVHGIDREESRQLPNARVDFTDLYPDGDAFERRTITDPTAWDAIVRPRLASAARTLEAFTSRRVHVVASVRLPVWFAIGRTLPGVRRWIISLNQDGVEWASDARGGSAGLVVLTDELIPGNGEDLVVCVALRHDPTADVRDYVTASGIPAGRLYTVTGETGVGPVSVVDAAWATSWVTALQDALIAKVRETDATRIHLFMAGPAGVALLLGHRWNVLPPVTVYEHQGGVNYAPTFHFPA
ncbi:SAVED domain-containing protein [Segeticoccus rhizosphaerae]|uniref:SAVED domain-containing protein n=1 Tax=Segeticoccus rhizosphaerae TaxID=1104777 RepID=UPI0010C022AD|nr:SAVED domain-containing protein [Ornithinicoccus soli]